MEIQITLNDETAKILLDLCAKYRKNPSQVIEFLLIDEDLRNPVDLEAEISKTRKRLEKNWD